MNKQEKWLRENYKVDYDFKSGEFKIRKETKMNISHEVLYGGEYQEIGVSGLPTGETIKFKPTSIKKLKETIQNEL